MTLNVKHPEADNLARALANKTGKSITHVVIKALRECLLREEGKREPIGLKDELIEISQRCAALPDLDKRLPEEILGYNQHGLPK